MDLSTQVGVGGLLLASFHAFPSPWLTLRSSLTNAARSDKGLWISADGFSLRVTMSAMSQRFLKLEDVQQILNISSQQAYALVRSGELPAIQVGGRGMWRVESSELEAYIERQYAAARDKASQAQSELDA